MFEKALSTSVILCCFCIKQNDNNYEKNMDIKEHITAQSCVILSESNKGLESFSPHLDPCTTGQAPCRVAIEPRPDRFRLYQKAAAPLAGHTAVPRRGKAVAPPLFTSLSWQKQSKMRSTDQFKTAPSFYVAYLYVEATD